MVFFNVCYIGLTLTLWPYYVFSHFTHVSISFLIIHQHRTFLTAIVSAMKLQNAVNYVQCAGRGDRHMLRARHHRQRSRVHALLGPHNRYVQRLFS